MTLFVKKIIVSYCLLHTRMPFLYSFVKEFREDEMD